MSASLDCSGLSLTPKTKDRRVVQVQARKEQQCPARRRPIMLWLFVINLGVTFGAGIYEHRIVVPRWLKSTGNAAATWNADAARQDDTGRKFWAFVSTMPLTLLTLISLYACLAC